MLGTNDPEDDHCGHPRRAVGVALMMIVEIYHKWPSMWCREVLSWYWMCWSDLLSVSLFSVSPWWLRYTNPDISNNSGPRKYPNRILILTTNGAKKRSNPLLYVCPPSLHRTCSEIGFATGKIRSRKKIYEKNSTAAHRLDNRLLAYRMVCDD